MAENFNGKAPAVIDFDYFKPIQVDVEGSSREDFEYAFRKFKLLFQRERVVGQLKEKMYYEKPSAKKRRKKREAQERLLINAMRENMIKTGEWDRRQKKKAQNKIRKEERRMEGLYD